MRTAGTGKRATSQLFTAEPSRFRGDFGQAHTGSGVHLSASVAVAGIRREFLPPVDTRHTVRFNLLHMLK